MEDLPAWDYATAAEACLALEDWAGAEQWLRKYLSAKDVDALPSPVRSGNLPIWGLRVDGPGGELIPVLRAALLLHKHGRLDLTPAQVHRMHGAKANAFERILGDTGLQTHAGCARASSGRGQSPRFVSRTGGVWAPGSFCAVASCTLLWAMKSCYSPTHTC